MHCCAQGYVLTEEYYLAYALLPALAYALLRATYADVCTVARRATC
jgi:hypothetical protein